MFLSNSSLNIALRNEAYIVVDTKPSHERLTKWRAEYAADLDSRYEEIKRQALEEFDRQWSHGTESSAASLPTLTVPRAADRKTGTPSRIEMLLEALPEFRGDTFTRADVHARNLEKYPQTEGRSLSSSISNILKEMAEKGQIERVERGKRIQDPWIYRLRENQSSQVKGPHAPPEYGHLTRRHPTVYSRY
jgi:hypothetical protein